MIIKVRREISNIHGSPHGFLSHEERGRERAIKRENARSRDLRRFGQRGLPRAGARRNANRTVRDASKGLSTFEHDCLSLVTKSCLFSDVFPQSFSKTLGRVKVTGFNFIYLRGAVAGHPQLAELREQRTHVVVCVLRPPHSVYHDLKEEATIEGRIKLIIVTLD